jgi:hypothetical protein
LHLQHKPGSIARVKSSKAPVSKPPRRPAKPVVSKAPPHAPKVEVPPVGLLELEPGIFVNETGQYVDRDGMLLGYRLRVMRLTNKAVEAEERDRRALGHKPRDVVEVLQSLAMDSQGDDEIRIKAATAAAPYVRRKMPIGIDGGADGAPINMAVTMDNLKGLSAAELTNLRKLLEKAKVETVEG